MSIQVYHMAIAGNFSLTDWHFFILYGDTINVERRSWRNAKSKKLSHRWWCFVPLFVKTGHVYGGHLWQKSQTLFPNWKSKGALPYTSRLFFCNLIGINDFHWNVQHEITRWSIAMFRVQSHDSVTIDDRNHWQSPSMRHRHCTVTLTQTDTSVKYVAKFLVT